MRFVLATICAGILNGFLFGAEPPKARFTPSANCPCVQTTGSCPCVKLALPTANTVTYETVTEYVTVCENGKCRQVAVSKQVPASSGTRVESAPVYSVPLTTTYDTSSATVSGGTGIWFPGKKIIQSIRERRANRGTSSTGGTCATGNCG